VSQKGKFPFSIRVRLQLTVLVENSAQHDERLHAVVVLRRRQVERLNLA
jgi:hypothetical protein